MTTVQLLRRIENKIDLILEQKTKPKWVKVGFITKLTGWKKEKMRQAREQSIITYERREDGIYYDLNCWPWQFIKRKF